MKPVFSLIVFLLLTFSPALQAQYWTISSPQAVPRSADDVEFPFAQLYQVVALDAPALLEQLEKSSRKPVRIQLPMPDGRLATVYAREDPVIAPGLAKKYPELKTYRIRSEHIRGRIGWTYQGFHASLRTPQGRVWIDPYLLHQHTYYKVYQVGENLRLAARQPFACGVDGEAPDPGDLFSEADGQDASLEARNAGPLLTRTYRAAVACTGEYAQFHGGTVQQALSAIVVAMNRINEVTETDLAVRLELVEDNDQIVFLDPDTDPFNNANPGTLLSNVQSVINQNIGIANYDVGHVVSTGPSAGGGIATLEGVCFGTQKGNGVSTRAQPVNDPFVINILAHEFGHQFGASHTMSSCQNVSPSTAYEPGGGSTIMGYAGICSPENNLVLNADPYYHTASLEQIFRYMRTGNGNDCPVVEDFGNTEPELELDYEDGFFIPISTPFQLTAAATDAEGDSLTYCWEQFDKEEGIQTPPGQPIGNCPLFRSLPPTPDPTRTFPRINTILNNQSLRDEVLPDYSRDLTFRCTVRDNHPGGGAAVWDQIAFKATAQAGPFRVTHPNSDTVVWMAGDYVEVTWEVANTDQAPVNCRFVDIRLSLDGGFTYPILLAERTPNSGSASVSVPKVASDQVRLRVEAADNIFFDLSDRNFSIEPATQPGFSLEVDAPRYLEACTPVTLEIPIATDSLLGFLNPISLALVSPLPDGMEAEFLPGTVLPSESSMLSLTLPNTLDAQEVDLSLRASAVGADTTFRNLTLRIISNNFSDLQMVAPQDGETGILLSANFAWRDNPNAETYDIEIATSPAFGPTTVDAATGLTDTVFSPAILFEENTLYYWRIRPSNDCGKGDWLLPYGFHTFNAICNTRKPGDVPLNIPASSMVNVESTIFVAEAGAVNDINLPIVRGNHNIVRDIRISLVSPAGTVVRLFDQQCGGTAPYNLGFDDEAPQPIQCPPDDGIVFQPVEPLAGFDGENTQGEWTLRIEVPNFGGGGALEDWELEFCANVTPTNPVLLRNDTFFTPRSVVNTILNDRLQVEDDDQGPGELVYTLVTVPQHGELRDFDRSLKVGDTFTQTTIDIGALLYEHNGDDNPFDGFAFTVKDGTGGWLPTQFFRIAYDPDAPVSTTEPALADRLRIFPNPAGSRLTVEWDQPSSKAIQLALFNAQGQQMTVARYAGVQQRIALDVSHLSPGMYILQLRSGEQWLSRKVQIAR